MTQQQYPHPEPVDELAMLVRRLVQSLRKAAPDNDLADQALDYLKRYGMGGTFLRDVPANAPLDVPAGMKPSKAPEAIGTSTSASAPENVPALLAGVSAPTVPPASQRDELLQVAIDFIGTLTGMAPPPIEVAPPEVFAPFYAFVERVQAITAPQAPAADATQAEARDTADAQHWRIDTSAGRPILVYKDCSVIEDEQARYVLGLIAAHGAGAADALDAARYRLLTPADVIEAEDEFCQDDCSWKKDEGRIWVGANWTPLLRPVRRAVAALPREATTP